MPFRGVGTNLRIIDLNGHACRWVAGKDVIEDVVCDEVAELVGVADTHRFSASHYRHARTPFTKANNKKAHPVSGRQETKRAGWEVLGEALSSCSMTSSPGVVPE